VIDDPGQSSRGHAELLAASRRERPLVVADPVGSAGGRRGMADEQQLHGRPARARGSLRRGALAPGLATPALEPRPLFEEGGARLLSPLALSSDEGLGKGVAGIGTVRDLMEIALDYHGVLMFSKNVLDLSRLVEEALRAPADRRAHELCSVPGALHPGADGMQVLGARAAGQRLDRPAELAELRGGDAEQRDVRAADAGAPEGRLEPRDQPGIPRAVEHGPESAPRSGAVGVEAAQEPAARRARRGPERGHPRPEMRAEDVEIADLPERGSKSAELTPETFDPPSLEERPPGAEDGPEPADRDAHLVKVLGVSSRPRSPRVGPDDVHLSAHRDQDVMETRVDRHRWSARRVERTGRTVAWAYARSQYVVKMSSNRHEGLSATFPGQDRPRRGLDIVPSHRRHRPPAASVL